MQNTEIYGLEKLNEEFQKRAAVLEELASQGEKAARIMAWKSFMADDIRLDESNEMTGNLARLKYGEAVDLFSQCGMKMDIKSKKFVDHFFDELGVINRKVTKKGVQIVFYIFCALGLFGLYKLFS